MLPLIKDHFDIIIIVLFFVFKPDSSNLDYSTQPWPIELSASFKPTTTFLVVIQAQTSKQSFLWKFYAFLSKQDFDIIL